MRPLAQENLEVCGARIRSSGMTFGISGAAPHGLRSGSSSGGDASIFQTTDLQVSRWRSAALSPLRLRPPLQPLPAPMAAPAWVAKSNADAQSVLKVLAEFNPEFASQFGLPGYDDKAIDLKPGIEQRSRAAMTAARDSLQKKLVAESDPDVQPGSADRGSRQPIATSKTARSMSSTCCRISISARRCSRASSLCCRTRLPPRAVRPRSSACSATSA